MKRGVDDEWEGKDDSSGVEQEDQVNHFIQMFLKGYLSLYQIYVLSRTSSVLRQHFTNDEAIDLIFRRVTGLTTDDMETSQRYRKWTALLQIPERTNKLQLLAAYIMSAQKTFEMVRGPLTITYTKVTENLQTGSQATTGTLVLNSKIVPMHPQMYVPLWQPKLFGNNQKQILVNKSRGKYFLIFFIYDHLDAGWLFKTSCLICGRIESNYVCGGCQSASYCSQECQNQDWYFGFHQNYCPQKG